MNTAPWSLKDAARAFARGWNSFFHEPCDARIPAAIRIVYATIVLIHLAVLYPDLDRWFTANGVLTMEAAKKAYREGIAAALRKGDLHAKEEMEGALSMLE